MVFRETQGRQNQIKTYLVIALLFFILFQLLFLFFSPFVFYHEEQKVTTLGVDILNGRLRLPLWFYLDSPHLGGSIYAALLAIPFYLVFGKISLALKISGLSLAAVNFLIWARFLVKEYGLKILLPFSLLFALPPTRLLMHYFIRAGNTMEMILVISLILITAYYFLKGGAEDRRRAFFLGFLSGFSLWIQYASLAAILTFGLAWFLEDRKFLFKKIFLVFLAGFFVGLLPFLIFNFQYGFASFTADQLSDFGILNIKLARLPGKFFAFFKVILPRSFLLLSGPLLSEGVVSLVFYFLIILSLVALGFWAIRKKKSFVFLLFLFLVFSFFLMNFFNAPLNAFPAGKFAEAEDMRVFSYYYPGFFHPFLLIGLSVFLFRLLGARRKILKTLGCSFLILLLLILGNNFWANIRVPDIVKIPGKHVGFPSGEPIVDVLDIVPVGGGLYFNRYLFYLHEDIYANAYESGYHFSRSSSLFNKLLVKLDPAYREIFIIGAGHSFNLLLRKDLDFDEEKLFLGLVDNFSLEEKELFFKNTLVGEVIFFGGGKRVAISSYNRLKKIRGLSEEDGIKLKDQLMKVLAEEGLPSEN
jgi:hypothetical protein